MERRDYGHGTYLTVRMPFSFFVGGRVLCSDGNVRALARIASTADTFYSVPAAVKVKGRTVSGYVTFECMDGLTVETDGRPTIAKFVATGGNSLLLPNGAYREEA